MHYFKILIAVFFSLLISGCVVKPEMVKDYDPQCNIVKKKIKLSVKQISTFEAFACSGNHDCKAEFVAQVGGAVLLLPISAIVSGSIALVGNTLFWLQEQKDC